MEYNHAGLEKKWQDFWDTHKTFKSEADTSKPKYYALDMFPFPSGNGLHVGHPEGYTATDIMCRYKRHNGFNVLHPMGWDSFGLPAENFAIQTGTHPEVTTNKNIDNFRRQLKMLGFSYDWDREVATSNVDYYKWTQWIFVELYNKGLAYEDSIEVNWCPFLKTVLANEEIVDGKSERGGHPVVQMKMNQWMLKITEYAERLLTDLDDLDWPENIKEMQRNWIGKSTGAQIKFNIQNSSESFEVFTTRPDTIYGVTYVVLAPDHSLVDKIVTAEHKTAVKEYQEATAKKSSLERTDLNKDKSGVWTGAYAINPVNGKVVPVWIGDYVLSTYGTGAVMAVPAHDQRDYEFAVKYKLPMIQVLEGDISEKAHTEDGAHINSEILNGLIIEASKKKIVEHLSKNKWGEQKINYKLRDWIFSRQRYWGEPFPLLKYDDGTVRILDKDELPVVLPPVEKYEPSGTGESPLANITEWLYITDPKTGKKAKRETNTMPNWAGSCWYYLRYCDPRNANAAFDKEKEKYWMPVDLYVGGAEHAVMHLLYARFWHKVLFDLGYVSTKEPFKKLVNQGLILGEDGEKMSKSRGNVINPDDVVKEYGADSLRLYEMFMGPLEKVKPWQTAGVKGVFNFLRKSYELITDNEVLHNGEEDLETTRLLHKTIKKVTEDIEEMRFNTAISAMMVFMNHIARTKKISKSSAKSFTLLLEPFAPHAAEDMWSTLVDCVSKLAYEKWPSFDPELAKDDKITVGVQINGKTRETIDVPADISKEDFFIAAKANERIAGYLKDKEIVKEIYVPGKICNFVIKG